MKYFANKEKIALQWRENCVVLSSKSFTENFRIVTAFTRTLGKTSGLVKGLKTPIQLGDIDDAIWKGRSAEQLGTFKMENIFSPFTYVFNNSMGVLAIESVCFLCAKGLPEKAPHPKLFDSLKALLLSISQKNWLANYAHFEVDFLSEVGSGLSLSKCAVTGKIEDLFYVSPKTGCAVAREIGEKYKDRLFILPKFLNESDENPTANDVFCALRITEHFLKMYFCGINGGKLPLSRDYLMAEVEKILEKKYEN
ncbi:MAG: DNA repair protein RecO [Holosporaceae bacterium]|jgi:DNA repair protein RecO (recombination protein O)|nr:DNA repair protein RecO [Holosporaceae bacterium]